MSGYYSKLAELNGLTIMLYRVIKPSYLSVKNRTRRLITRSPFRSDFEKRLVIHASYHKAGSTWFNNVLNGVANHFGLYYQLCEPEDMLPSTEIYLCNDSKLDLSRLAPHIGTHMIRDPRDLVVSGYFYHKHTSEPWAHTPRPEYAGKSYQQYLNSLNQHDGLLAEIKRTTPNIVRMAQWDYKNPSFLELKYEEMLNDERTIWHSIFSHYGFNTLAIEVSISITEGLTLSKMKGKSISGAMGSKHVRSGRVGQWRDYFTNDHKSYLQELTDDALIKLGYESTMNW